MILFGGTLFLVIFVIVILSILVKNDYEGNACGCGFVVSSLIVIFVIFVFVKSCQQYEDDWGENGRYTPKTTTAKSSADDIRDTRAKYAAQHPTAKVIKGNPYDGYYPERELDSIAHRKLPSGEKSKEWEEGYRWGTSVGYKDQHNGTPYKSYSFGCFDKNKRAADFKRGYWIGYKEEYPSIDTLTTAEVRKRIAEWKKEFKEWLKVQRHLKALENDDYHRGYKRGYNDGESDGACGSEYGLSSSDNGSKEYRRGYADSYENGYNDGKY